MNNIGVGPITVGVPIPRKGGFMQRLRRDLERMEVGDMVELNNVQFKHERTIRARMPKMQSNLGMKFSVRVGLGKQDRSLKRTLQIWRTE